jgi:hypothetical protein
MVAAIHKHTCSTLYSHASTFSGTCAISKLPIELSECVVNWKMEHVVFQDIIELVGSSLVTS